MTGKIGIPEWANRVRLAGSAGISVNLVSVPD
jgi:hypothetical protein